MKQATWSFLKWTLISLTVTVLIAVPVVAVWASSLTEAEVKIWKMWINLAISGYADPMPMNTSAEKAWWGLWEYVSPPPVTSLAPSRDP